MADHLYQVGEPVPLTATFTDANGTPADTTVALEIRKPDGTVLTPTPTHAATGVYTYNVPAGTIDQTGLWWYAFIGSGTVAAVEQNSFLVEERRTVTNPLTARALVTLDEAREFVFGNALDDSNDTRLIRRINRMSEAVYAYTNREWLPVSTATRKFGYPGYGLLSLGDYDLQTVTSIVAFTDYPTAYQLTLNAGTTTALGDYRLQPAGGHRPAGTYKWIEFGRHPYTALPLWPYDLYNGYRDFGGRFEITITGTWGIGVVPDDVKQAVLIAIEESYVNPTGAASRTVGPLSYVEPLEPDVTVDARWRALPAESRALLADYVVDNDVIAA
jgi:hypothetical protein